MNPIRERIERLRSKPYADTGYRLAIADVLSILDEELPLQDKGELVAEDTGREGEFLKGRGELLRDVISRMLTPIPERYEIVSPGDIIRIYKVAGGRE